MVHGEHAAPITNNKKKIVTLIKSTGVGEAEFAVMLLLQTGRAANDGDIFYAFGPDNIANDANAFFIDAF
jgi:hypothetical protein